MFVHPEIIRQRSHVVAFTDSRPAMMPSEGRLVSALPGFYSMALGLATQRLYYLALFPDRCRTAPTKHRRFSVMGCWDELCLLCGIWSGKAFLMDASDIDEEAQAIVSELRLDHPEPFSVVQSALSSALGQTSPLDDGESVVLLPDGVDDYNERERVAVGYFAGDQGTVPVRGDKIPDGRRVEMRRVCEGDSATFEVRLSVKEGREIQERLASQCTAGDDSSRANFFFCRRCYAYLVHWVDWGRLPPRSDASSLGTMSIPAELYEIVNSRKELRGEIAIPCHLICYAH